MLSFPSLQKKTTTTPYLALVSWGLFKYYAIQFGPFPDTQLPSPNIIQNHILVPPFPHTLWHNTWTDRVQKCLKNISVVVSHLISKKFKWFLRVLDNFSIISNFRAEGGLQQNFQTIYSVYKGDIFDRGQILFQWQGPFNSLFYAV